MPKHPASAKQSAPDALSFDTLNVEQRAALASAAARPDHSLLPLPADLVLNRQARDSLLRGLIKAGFAEQRPAPNTKDAWRVDQSGQAWMAFLTAAAAAHLLPERGERSTKQQRLLTLLRSEDGFAVNDLAAELGWLPHTMRAALTRLKQAGHAVQRTKQDGVSRYRIETQP